MDSPIVELKDAVVCYRESVALNGISLNIYPGEFISVIGPNGAGKTTLLTVINGMADLTEGSVSVFGITVSSRNRNTLRKRIGYVSQAQNIDPRTPMSVIDVVLTGRYGRLGFLRRPGRSDLEIAREMLKVVGLSAVAERPIGHLSGGEGQRVAIARCLAQEPDLLLLDEVTASLDWRAKNEILELVKEIQGSRRLTTLFVTHDLAALPAGCGRVLLMRMGQIRADGPSGDVLTDENLSDVYAVPLSEVKRTRGSLPL